MNNISVVIITKDEENIIGKCLNAARQIADDLIIIDAESTDNTINIAQEFGARCFTLPWISYSYAKNFGITKAKNSWILAIDADEILSPELIKQISSINLEEGVVYAMLWRTIFCGQALKFTEMRPKWHFRLFEKDRVKWNKAEVHEKLIIPKKFIIKKIEGEVNHYSYQSESELKMKTHLYAQLAAKEMYSKKINHSFIKKTVAPYFRFFKSYLLQLGILEGRIGFLISKMSFNTAKLRYQYLDEIKDREEEINT